MNVGSLFSGIGGIDLGLERAGMHVTWFCEQDAYCQRVLEARWPGVPIYPDVRELEAEPVDLICGGFPCQPFSAAGKRLGVEDERWLWPPFARVVGELRPRYVLVENVPGLLAGHRGMGHVLGDLAALGYDAEWDCIPASAVGAPHRRDRVWIVAYPEGEPIGTGLCAGEPPEEWRGRSGNGSRPGGAIQDADSRSVESWGLRRRTAQASSAWWWASEPDVGRVAHGVPSRLDRLAALGNAVVPQVAEWIGLRILEREAALNGL